MKRLIIPFSLIFLFCFSAFADAQDPRERRRALFEDLLKGLIESQQNNNQPPPTQVRPGTTIPFPPTVARPPRTVVEVSPEMVKARQSLAAWNMTCAQLIQEIRHHEYESPQLRPLLADTLKVKANIELLSRKAQLYPTIQPLVADFQIIDADWRILSHRLKASGGLTKECTTFLNTISALDSQLCSTFGIEPQINRLELQRLATKLSSDYDHLLHDVYYVVRSQPDGRQILNDGKQLQTLIAQSSALINRGSYDSIVDAYRRVIGNWKIYSRRLHLLGDERIRRSISDMEVTGALLREQLWLPVEIDREYLGGMADNVAKDAQKVFDSITLSQLLKTKMPGNTVNSAREFQAACDTFSRSIRSGSPMEDLQWDFRLFEVQWEEMHHMFHEFEISRVDNRLEDIEFSMATLKNTFGETPVMDYSAMRQLTANLGALLRQTSLDIHRRVVVPRYDNQFHDSICSTADRIANSADQLHQTIMRNPNVTLRRQDLSDLFLQWRTLKPMMMQCQPVDRDAFLKMRGQIEPLMVKLQVVFAD